MPKHHILIVEDDLNLGFLLMEYLQLEGMRVTWRKDALSGLQALQQQCYDLAVLDVMMPGMDGFNLAKQIRGRYPSMPFLFLTARLLKADKLKGYRLGAEDYLTKPFDEEELLCKINVILRRQALERAAPPAPTAPEAFDIGQYHFNYSRQEISLGEQTRRLTEKESEVLLLLCRNRNRILKRDQAVKEIYGKEDYFLGRSFDVFISRLRKILREDPTVSIENVYKV
ncbi:MAG: response regulator transcription factor, partial [Bacteroidota bacterium]